MKIENLAQELRESLKECNDLKSFEAIKVTFTGKSGYLAQEMQKMGKLPPEDKKEFGQKINVIKQEINSLLEQKKHYLEEQALNERLKSENLDVSLPPREQKLGKIHPITQCIEEITAILGSLGFEVKEGNNIEDDWHNFTALNIDENHPARQMHDTFYMPNSSDGQVTVLRTHTSPVQIRTMKNGSPPFRFISPGRTYRCDSDITHAPMFHQVEGVLVDKNINMAHLKYVITEFIKAFFEVDNIPIRFRPSFFPFTEPSAEVDIGCIRKNGEFKIGAGDDWLEVLGCGMIHPKVLENCKIDTKKYQGLAFGLGVERFAMLKYGIADLRNFFEGDQRWIKHYGFSGFDIPSIIGGLTR